MFSQVDEQKKISWKKTRSLSWSYGKKSKKAIQKQKVETLYETSYKANWNKFSRPLKTNKISLTDSSCLTLPLPFGISGG